MTKKKISCLRGKKKLSVIITAFCLLFSGTVWSQSIKQDSLWRKDLDASQSTSPVKNGLATTKDTLANLKKEETVAVYLEKIYMPDSPEFARLKKELNLYVSRYIMDQYSTSKIKCILFYERRKPNN